MNSNSKGWSLSTSNETVVVRKVREACKCSFRALQHYNMAPADQGPITFDVSERARREGCAQRVSLMWLLVTFYSVLFPMQSPDALRNYIAEHQQVISSSWHAASRRACDAHAPKFPWARSHVTFAC